MSENMTKDMVAMIPEGGLNEDGTLAPTVYCGTPTSAGSRSPASTAATSIDEENAPRTPTRIASGTIMIQVGNKVYSMGQMRGMADTVAKARQTGELPGSIACLQDADIIVEDYNHLCRLRELRGNPSADNPPSAKYKEARVDVTKVINDRDEKHLSDEAAQAIAAQRIQKFKEVADQEDRLLGLFNNKTNAGQVDLTALTDEIIDTIEVSMSDAAGPLRLNANRMNATANTMDNTAHNMDNTAHNMGSTAQSLNSSMAVLSSSVNVVGAQINGVSAQVQNLGSLLRILELVNQRSDDRINGSLQNLGLSVQGLQTLIDALPEIISHIVGEIVRETVQVEVAQGIGQIIVAQAQAMNAELAHNVKKDDTKKWSMKSMFKRLFKSGGSA
jgi:hypothetical protein